MITKNPTPQHQLRVLVVDDRVDVTYALSLLLRMLGHKVKAVHNARAAVEMGERHRPDLVFLDIGLPDASGYDVCKTMRESEWGARAFIVALTGRNEAGDLIQAANSGFDRHVCKPMALATLQEILGTVVLRATWPGQHPHSGGPSGAFL